MLIIGKTVEQEGRKEGRRERESGERVKGREGGKEAEGEVGDYPYSPH